MMKAARPTREHLVSFLDGFVEPVWIVDRSFRLLYLNPAAVEHFSRVATAIGGFCYQSLFENPKPCPFCSLRRVFASGEPVHTTFTLLAADGRNHVYALSNYPCYGRGGRVESLLAVCADRTEGADMFAEIARLQGLAAMGEYSAELTHEIRNPLNSIEIQMGLLQRMAARLPTEQGESFLRVVEVVRQESRRLNNLAADFLKIRKSRSLKLEVCDVMAVAERVAGLLREEAGAAGVAVKFEIDDGPVLITADADKLQQAFLNLTRNSLEALNEAQSSKPAIRISGRCENGRVVFEFADNGPGIPLPQQPKIFDLFYTTKAFGTGIGLHLSRDIIAAHDGKLSFVSNEEGTVFTVVLPSGSGIKQ